MQIVELEVKLPYRNRGKILGRVIEVAKGKIRDLHFLPPSQSGVSEVKMEIAVDNAQNFLKELKKIIGGKSIKIRVLTEA